MVEEAGWSGRAGKGRRTVEGRSEWEERGSGRGSREGCGGGGNECDQVGRRLAYCYHKHKY